MTLYRVDIDRDATDHIYVEAPDESSAIADAKEHVIELDFDDVRFNYSALVAKPPPLGYEFWTGGPDGHWESLPT